MMCAQFLRRDPPGRRPNALFRWSERTFDANCDAYMQSLDWVLRHRRATLVCTGLTLVATVWLYVVIPKGFLPQQDTGLLVGVTEAAQDISFAAMAERQRMLAEVVARDPAVRTVDSFVGVGTVNPTLVASRRRTGAGNSRRRAGRSARKGRSIRSVREPRGGPPSSAGRRPSSTRRSMTARSRSGSIGGFVTWANDWRRWSAIGRSIRPRPGVGVSSPMLHSGSWPSSAIVLMSSRAFSAWRPARNRRSDGVAGPASGSDDSSSPGRVRVGGARRVVDRQPPEQMGLCLGLEDEPTPRFDQEQLARSEPATADRPFGRERDRARLARDCNEPIVRDREGSGPEPVAIGDRPDPPAVTEDDGRWAVPGGEEAGRPTTERRDMRMRRSPQRERLGHRREQGRTEVPAGRDQELEHLVERLGVRAVGRHERTRAEEVADVVGRGGHAIVGPAVDLGTVAADGVDLAVVGDRPERLGKPPGGLGVRRVALVEERVGDRGARRPQIRVEILQAGTGDQAL